MEIKKLFLIPFSTLDEHSLYDEYIDRPKLSVQKKTFEYIVPPPSRGFGTIILLLANNPMK